MRNWLAIIITLLLLSGCAKMGQPDGGWYDDTPPHVLATSPEDKSTGVDAKKIYIYFDEFIKLDNPTEKVVISPPQLEAPDIKGAGNRITVTINDSLVPNTTYTVDFSDAISDNNEGNPMGNYTYSFSTGEHIDTLEVSGCVVEAENMEPIKGILVGLYNNLEDSAFTTQPMLRVARTDSRGRFVIKGVAEGNYRIYALQDADGNYFFSQKSEKLAFSNDIITPTFKPDVRQDTLWSDTLHIAKIEQVGYTHFFPDDIVLRAFTEVQNDRFLVKTERKDADCFTMFFSYGHPQLPEITGLNFDATDAFLMEASEHLDTLTYWLRDTLLVNQDSLQMTVGFMATDSTGVLAPKLDTLNVLSKNPYARRMKDLQKEQEKWEKEQEKAKKKGRPYLTEMPPTPLETKLQIPGDMAPNGYISFEFPTPLMTTDTTKIHLLTKIDTVEVEKGFVLQELPSYLPEDVPHAVRKLILVPDSTDNLWTAGGQYSLVLDSAAFVDIYGKASKDDRKSIKIKKEEDFTSITFHVAKTDESPYVAHLLDRSNKVVKVAYSSTGDVVFNYVKPGEYYLCVIADTNNNGIWDTGNYAEGQQAEMVYYYPDKIECRAMWPLEKSWNPQSTINILKPSEITKQKPDKEKKIRNRNAERARKLGIDYIPKNH